MQLLKGPMTALVCFSLFTTSVPGWSETVDTPNARPSTNGGLQGDERILQALNRFTFGPRPGDLDKVKAMGLDQWFDEQLHPAQIDQHDLNARLAQFPAMQWSSEDLLFRLPSNAVIRQVIDGKLPMPDRGALHAVYENQVTRVSAKRQQQEQKKQLAAAGMSQAVDPKSANTMAMNNATRRSGGSTADIASGNMNPSATAGQPAMSPEKSLAPPVDPTLYTTILALPPRQRVIRMAAMKPEDYDAFNKSLKGPQRAALTADMPADMREAAQALENPEHVVVDELMAQRLTRDIYSSAQLQEVMTDFWFNHFNIYLRKDEATPYYLVTYERDVIRPHALGKFEDLLEATAHSPAMLLYLDNSSSTGPDSAAAQKAKEKASKQPAAKRKAPEGLNENYARELMELHTLGVNGGYSQADVIQAAKILTGWTVDKPQLGGGFKFDPDRHEPGAKKVLGKKFKDQGEREGEELLHMLATRPATAKFISRKLAVRFVSDDPPQSLVDRMAKAYLSSGGDIATVLKTMYRSPEFWSTDLYRAKVKTPLEYVVSAARASNADFTNMQPLANALRDMGMPLYGAIPPTGYKWDAADWVSTGALVNRMNFALSLAANRLPGATTTWAPQPAGAADLLVERGDRNSAVQPTPDSEEARLESLLIAGGVSSSTRSAVLNQFAQQTSQAQPSAMNASMQTNKPQHPPAAIPTEKQDQVLAGLLLGSPEFQRR